MKINKSEILKCQICLKSFDKTRGIAQHVKCHGFTSQSYYDKFFKLENEGICLNCKNPTKYIGLEYGRYCCEKCCQSSPLFKQSVINSNLKKYGVKSPMQVKEIQEKGKITNLEKYGTEYTFQADSVKKKIVAKNLEKYGVKYSLQNKEVFQKARDTMVEKYGVEYPSQLQERNDAMRLDNLEKYGVEWNTQRKDVREKTEQTNLKRYGVIAPFQNNKILEKAMKKMKQSKPYILPSGTIIYKMGYEPQFLNYIFTNNILKEDELDYSPNGIKYIHTNDNKSHWYFPDFYIPKWNLIIEIKGSYILNKHQGLEEHKLKEQATVKAGYKYLLILDNNFEPFINFIKTLNNS